MKRIKQGPLADMEVIMMTAYGSIQVAVEAVKLGAFDFVTKPFRNEDVFPLLARIERLKRPAAAGCRRPPSPPPTLDQRSSASRPRCRRVKRMVEICARTDANVLLVRRDRAWARTFWPRSSTASPTASRSPSSRSAARSFPPQLIESELYGHEKGSFTGADQHRKGRFDLAEGGTLYLDDVDDIPLEQQSKLLAGHRGKSLRAGRRHARPSRPTYGSSLPPSGTCWRKSPRAPSARTSTTASTCCGSTSRRLRERLEDVPLLAEHLLRQIAADLRRQIEPAAVEVLKRHDWPGNVRELYHTLERAYLVGSGQITAEVLSSEIGGLPSKQRRRRRSGSFQAAMDQAERELLDNALRAAGGNKTAAAAALGMKPSTFRDKLAKHGLG